MAKFKITTVYTSNAIVQTVTFQHGLTKDSCEDVIRLRDVAVKKALVKLGWTPPSDKKQASKIITAH